MATEAGSVRKLPNMNEFSPGTIGDLRPVVQLIKKLQPDRSAIVAAIEQSVEKIAATPRGKSRRTRAANVLIGMSQCGLFETDSLSEAGEALAAIKDRARFYRELAKHLLTYQDCHITELFDAAQMVRQRGEQPTLRLVREQLGAMGFVLTHNEGNASKLRSWLEPAGVVDADWNVNEAVMSELKGITLSSASEFARLPRAQQIFLKTLRAQAGSGEWLPTSHILALAIAAYSKAAFPEGNIRARVLDPLENGGWIETQGKGAGRGGKSGQVRAMQKLLDVKAELEVEAAGHTAIPRELLDRETVPPSTLFKELKSQSTSVKGLALELLAMKVARALDLSPVKFHLRASSTGGAEADLVAEGIHLSFTRWLFQCKAKGLGGITVGEVSKEVGLAELLGAQVIVMLTTGTIKGSVQEFAKRVSVTSAKQVYLLDGVVMDQFQKVGPQRIVEEIRRQALEIQKIKRVQIEAASVEDPE